MPRSWPPSWRRRWRQPWRRSPQRPVTAHGPGICAILFYGSCLRDGYRDGLMIDLYLLCDDYAAVHRSRSCSWLNRLDPAQRLLCGDRPRRCHCAGQVCAGEPAAVRASDGAGHPQPVFLGTVRPAHRPGLGTRLDIAARVRAALVRPSSPPSRRPAAGAHARRRGRALGPGLTESYRTELRAEKPHRARPIVQHDVERYRRITAAFAGTAPSMPAAAAARRWWRRRDRGQGAVDPAAGQGIVHLRRRCGLHRLEDQPPRRRSGRVQPVGAPPPDPGGTAGALAADAAGGGALAVPATRSR